MLRQTTFFLVRQFIIHFSASSRSSSIVFFFLIVVASVWHFIQSIAYSLLFDWLVFSLCFSEITTTRTTKMMIVYVIDFFFIFWFEKEIIAIITWRWWWWFEKAKIFEHQLFSDNSDQTVNLFFQFSVLCFRWLSCCCRCYSLVVANSHLDFSDLIDIIRALIDLIWFFFINCCWWLPISNILHWLVV